jgi:hypothetical protein
VTMAVLLVRSIPGGKGSTLGCLIGGILRPKDVLKLSREVVGFVVEESSES